MQKIISLAKRRGFIFPSSEIYGGFSSCYDFGPLGIELVENIKRSWWNRFVRSRPDMVGISTTIIMSPKVWQASGHVSGFSDPLIECKECHARHRGDNLLSESQWKKLEKKLEKAKDKEKLIALSLPSCPDCKKKNYTLPRNFNLMFKTFVGPVEDETSTAYLRPETAQGMFVNFNNIISSSRKTLPFGIAQIGKAFRNEITPKNYIFRTREFEQMEIEYFIPEPKNEKEWQKTFDYWRKEMWQWIDFLGIKRKNVKENDIPKEELAHYSKRTIDFEYKFPFGTKELYGLAYRTDFDLKNHEKMSKENMKYRDPKTGKEYWPHVIEPTFGVERTVLALLVDAFDEEKMEDGTTRTVLRFSPAIAPIKVAILPLLQNKPEIVKKAKEIEKAILPFFSCDYDQSGSIGKRYRRQDEAGTPICLTVDFETLKDNTVTLRDRDTMHQRRVDIGSLKEEITKIINKD